MSLRDKGNQYFKQQRYEQALQCYEKYIDEDPNAEKKLAFCNMSFCYFKMGRFQESIQAADDSIEQDQQYSKAYYRKMMAFKEMKGFQYDVFINATLLLKYNRTMDESSKYDTVRILKEYKQKWITKLQNGRQVKVQETNCLLDLIDQTNVIGVQTLIKSERTVDSWLKKWNTDSTSMEEKWVQIQKVASEQQQFGMNLAYLFSNLFKDQEYVVISKKVNELKERLSKKMDIEEVQEDEVEKEEVQYLKQQMRSSSEDENLFESKNPSQKQQQRIVKQTLEMEMPSNKQNQNNSSNNSELIQKQDNYVKKSEMQAQESYQYKQNKLSESQIEEVYQLIKKSCFSERDVISGVQKSAQVILHSKYSRGVKGALLQLLKQRNGKQMGKIRKSFTKEEQKKVYNLLMSNGLQDYIGDFASKYLPK